MTATDTEGEDMQSHLVMKVGVSVVSMFLWLVPPTIHAQTEQAKPAPPPIEQPLTREGDFAIRLAAALNLGTTQDEVEAENLLGGAGIAPRNGWIADYPVTPDILSELQKSVSEAADARKIALGRDEALTRLAKVNTELSLAVKPYTGTKPYEVNAEEAEGYPNPAVINNYYYEQGPPMVTYYAPPPDYYYLYSWVPCPFWWSNFWFPGFFILRDFHKPFFFHNRVVFFSNHFNDIRAHRVFRIDPVARFSGRTFAGIGVPHARGFISTGVPRSAERIFNAPPTRGVPSSRTFAPTPRGGRTFTPPTRGGGRTIAPSTHGGHAVSAPSRGGGRSFAPPSRGGGMGAPSTRGGGGVPSRGERK
jgi:hypothetical protein